MTTARKVLRVATAMSTAGYLLSLAAILSNDRLDTTGTLGSIAGLTFGCVLALLVFVAVISA